MFSKKSLLFLASKPPRLASNRIDSKNTSLRTTTKWKMKSYSKKNKKSWINRSKECYANSRMEANYKRLKVIEKGRAIKNDHREIGPRAFINRKR